uniref:Peptidase M12B domain-containing protein n=1 Tax=Trichuris muris TaxID=70415 RepID=A0A5S6QY43_TRIMR
MSRCPSKFFPSWCIVIALLSSANTLQLHSIFSAFLESDFAGFENAYVDELDFDAKSFFDSGFTFHFRAFNETFKLRVWPEADLLVNEAAAITRDSHSPNGTFRRLPLRPCHYRGRVLSHKNANVALSVCSSLRGIIALDDHFLIIYPRYEHSAGFPFVDSGKKEGHLIYKRSVPSKSTFDEASLQHLEETVFHEMQPEVFCDVESSPGVLPLPFQGDYVGQNLPDLLTLELAVFTDNKLWQMFKSLYASKAEEELQDYAMSMINNVNLLFQQPTIRPKLKIKVVHFEMWKESPEALRSNVHKYGEAQLFLDAFCRFQSKMSDSGSRWDHATLLTGYDIYHSTTSVAGVAPVARMCDPQFSCSLIEGNHLGRSFVMAHEMGHNLGMLHDGIQNQCSQTCCLMSSVNGAGRTAWSPCSTRELQSFLLAISRPESSIRNCLSSAEKEPEPTVPEKKLSLPGQRYTADEQCEFFWGKGYRHEIPGGKSRADICYVLWCSNGGTTISSAHPALEGTWCGGSQWCKNGKCVQWPLDQVPVAIDGQWSAWSLPRHSHCSDCVVKGALRLRKEVRSCTSPSPNNGGEDCPGSAVRGLICPGESDCDNMSKKQFADRICLSIRDDPAKPDEELTGKSFQHTTSPCKIWCYLKNNMLIRSKGRYPDGTPCGHRRYCVAGACLHRMCGGEAIVSVQSECPDNVKDGDHSDKWSSWSQWSACSATCGAGYRSRLRTCLSQSCAQSAKEEATCQGEKCPHFWSDWSAWSSCSLTCGGGLRLRSRQCPVEGICSGKPIEFEQCATDKCSEAWGSWSSWSDCSATCGVGYKKRSRECNGSSPSDCDGMSEELVICENEQCQRSWSQWSSCSGHCGGGKGTRSRQIQCPLDSTDCADSNLTEVESCENNAPCGEWSPWQEWSACSSTCGHGTQRRSRVCLSRGSEETDPNLKCLGESTEVRSCNETDCNEARDSWSAWTSCSVSCGEGFRSRRKQCGSQTNCAEYIEKVSCNVGDCEFPSLIGAWRPWSDCSASCGTGQRRRSRNCLANDKNQCLPEELVETENCRGMACLSEPTWTEWSQWTTCSMNCGGGRQSRRRSCIRNSLSKSDCSGFSVEEQSCNTFSCSAIENDNIRKRRLMLPTWSIWSSWSRCSCHTGSHIRARMCIVNDVQTAGFCLGPSIEEASCKADDCDPVDGGWTLWSEWTACTGACNGQKMRFRLCSDPLPANRGNHCTGEAVAVESCPSVCSAGEMKSSGFWSNWSEWTQCYGTVCGRRKRQRTRRCESIQDGPYHCDGNDFDLVVCPEDEQCHNSPSGVWSVWTAWSDCRGPCDNTSKRRQRFCQMPTPSVRVSYGHSRCSGEAMQSEPCHLPVCQQRLAEWSLWSSWSACSSICNDGFQARFRRCQTDNGDTSASCLGMSKETRSCSHASQQTWCTSSVRDHELLESEIRKWEI